MTLSYNLLSRSSIILYILFSLRPVKGFADAPENWQIGFQDPATPIMQGIIDLHHDIFFFILVIIVFVTWIGGRSLYHFRESSNPIPEKILHGNVIEIAWTVTPSLILVLIAIPSFALLYSMDEVVDPAVTIKCIGHQWYWSYDYRDVDGLEFDSYIKSLDLLVLGDSREFDVDNRCCIPCDLNIRFCVSSGDVIHA